ncbi:uncharacterized protein [Physcomitrium patens]|uniref:uncharacterized protein n=1 Tax=Physcomitrium patens TaxID=3218 RepID=UPI003CCCD7F4
MLDRGALTRPFRASFVLGSHIYELKPRFEKFCDLQLFRSVLVALLRESSTSGSAFEDCVATVSGKRAELSFFVSYALAAHPTCFSFGWAFAFLLLAPSLFALQSIFSLLWCM